MSSPASALDAYLTQTRLRFIAGAILAVTATLMVISFCADGQGRTVFGVPLGADYVAFYVVGTILNENPASRLYDTKLQSDLYHKLQPEVPANFELPYANPPFLALPFRLLARLPFALSFFVWLMITAGLYVGALALMGRMTHALTRDARITAWLLALSFEPFIMECWLAGQTSAIGLFCFALAMDCERRQRSFAAGMALGLCWYKPTLLVVALPMLCVGRRYRMLAGMAATTGLLAVVSVLGVGWESCRDYSSVLFTFARATTGGPFEFRTWKYVDVTLFCRQLGGGGWWVLAPVLSAWPAWRLIKSWWSRTGDATYRWAATITLTLVLNVHVGIYDTVLVVLALMLTADICSQRSGRLLVALVYVTPWFSQSLAHATGFQFFTLVLLALGVCQLRRV